MSIEIMNAVWRQSASVGRARLTLLAIADHQGEMGAWPSITTLAKMVNTSTRSIKRDLQYLQELGELIVEVQNAPMPGQYKTNRYWIQLSGVTNPASGVTESSSGVTDPVNRGDTVGTQNLKRNLNKKHIEEQFVEFWNSYPNKQDKAKAFRAFQRALNRADFTDILAGAIAYSKDPRRHPDYTKFPATWLNGDAWENAAITPEARIRVEVDKKQTDAYLEELRKQEENRAPAPKCQHGNNIALCKFCLRD